MADKAKEKGKLGPVPEKKGGLLKNIFFLSLLALVVLGGLGVLSFSPHDLSDIDGYYEEPGILPPPGRDLAQVLRDAAKSDERVIITEREINHYLQRTVKFEQEGLLQGQVRAKGVWVRLDEGVAEIVLERELAFLDDRRHTISMFLKPSQRMNDDGSMSTKVHRSTGRYGKIKVIRGFMLLTKSSFESLGAVYSEELKLLKSMFEAKVAIKITTDYIQLDPPKR